MSIDAKPRHALGIAMKRKEDPRFLQGKGRFVEDVMLPNMLYLALVRSGGHRGRTAAELGVTRQGLTKLMTRLGIKN